MLLRRDDEVGPSRSGSYNSGHGGAVGIALTPLGRNAMGSARLEKAVSQVRTVFLVPTLAHRRR